MVAGIDALRAEHGRLFISVGVFDGLHLGHLYLLRHLREAATAHAARPSVITFDHHPDAILIGAAPPLLCDPDERLVLLRSAGVEVTVVQHFDRALQQTPYDAFVRRIAGNVDLAGFLMTPDTAFGNERRGTPETVAALGLSMGFEVVVVPPMNLAGRLVRSAEIRTQIAAGDLSGAADLLGRPYAVVGRPSPLPGGQVALQFPTPVALPPPGEYEVQLGSPERGALAGTTGRIQVLADSTIRIVVGAVEPSAPAVRITFA